jgi:hypothetical protein
MPLTTYTAGQVLTAASLNANLSFAANSPTAIFNEQQASGTNGGTFTSGSWVKRTLNTTLINTITGCSIASSVITLGAGTYNVTAYAPAYNVDGHKCRIQNTTAGTTLVLGMNAYTSNAGAYASNHSFASITFTLTGATNIELQHQAITTKATNGLGFTVSIASISEVYSQIHIVQVA